MISKILKLDEFVFWIHSMTQSELDVEFPQTFHRLNASDTKSESVNKMVSNEAIKFRLVLEYARFLKKKLVIEMFEGDDAFIGGGQKIDTGEGFSFYKVKDVRLFMDQPKRENVPFGKKIEDLGGKDIELCGKIFNKMGYLSQKLSKFK